MSSTPQEPAITAEDRKAAARLESFLEGRSEDIAVAQQAHIHRRCRDILDLASSCDGNDWTGIRHGEFEALLTDAAIAIRKLSDMGYEPSEGSWKINAWSIDSHLKPQKYLPTENLLEWLPHTYPTDSFTTLMAIRAYDLKAAPYGEVDLIKVCHALIHCRLFRSLHHLAHDFHAPDMIMPVGQVIGFVFSPMAPQSKNFHDFKPGHFRIYQITLLDLVDAFERIAWMGDSIEIARARHFVTNGSPDFIDEDILRKRARTIMMPNGGDWMAPWNIPGENQPEDVMAFMDRQAEIEAMEKMAREAQSREKPSDNS